MSKQMLDCASIYENNYIHISQMGKWEKLNYFSGLFMKLVAELQRELFVYYYYFYFFYISVFSSI